MNKWRRINGATGYTRFTWKMAVKTECVCVCYKNSLLLLLLLFLISNQHNFGCTIDKVMIR